MANRSPWLILLRFVFFLSGFTGLVFEVLWTRQLSHVVGATSVAMTCVFSVFVVCLSIGALLASRLRIYDGRAVALYGVFEVAIGVLGLGTTLLMLHEGEQLVRWIPHASGTWEVLVQMGATLALIGVPTVLMGATLPLMMNGIRSITVPSSEVAWIYAANVIGGAFGALACGFVLLWQLGVTGTATFALLVDVAIGVAALLVARWRLPSAASAAPEPPSPRVRPPEPSGLERAYPLLAFLTGFFALGYELLWGRMAKLYMGDRTMATATLLFIYLGCMAIGSFLVGVLRHRSPSRSIADSLTRFAGMLGVAAFAHLLGVVLLHAVLADPRLLSLLSSSSLPRVGVALAVTLVPVTTLGMAFPFLMQTAVQIDERPGLAVGTLYFVNSIGGALGALFGGFLAPRHVGTLGGFLALSLGTLLVALLCMAMGSGAARRRLAASAVLVALLVGAWALMPRNLLFHPSNETLVTWNEDEYGVQSVTRDPEGHLNVRNNRLHIAYTLGPDVTNFTQEMLAYPACLLAERCDRVLNIGTGYGITAGAFTNLDSVKSIKTIEILPFIVRIQEMFAPFNFRYFGDARVTRLCSDGRRTLAASTERYDIIAVNVLDPYVPGSSGLFTTDFWELARKRLAPGGVYGQLIWGPDAERLIRGLASVFPRVLRFPGGWDEHFNVIALAEDRRPRIQDERISPGVHEALKRFQIDDPERFFRRALREALRREASQATDTADLRLHTDDMPILEYRWARGDRLSATYDDYEQISMFDSLQVTP